MKSFLLGFVLFFSINAAATEPCAQPLKGQAVYKCEKMISSEIKGRLQDKIATAKYVVWLQDSNKALCIDGRNSSGPSVDPGKGSIMGDSRLPQTNKIIPKMWSQELFVTDLYWKLTLNNDDQITALHPNYPKLYDHYFLDLKSLELTVSNPTGIKSFATFKLSCFKSE